MKSKDVSLTGNLAATVLVLSILPIPYLEIIFMYIYRDYKYVITRALGIILIFRVVFISVESLGVVILCIMDTCGLIGAMIYFMFTGDVSKELCLIYQTIYNIILQVFIVIPSLQIPMESLLEYVAMIMIQMPYIFIIAIYMHKLIVKLADPIVQSLQCM